MQCCCPGPGEGRAGPPPGDVQKQQPLSPGPADSGRTGHRHRPQSSRTAAHQAPSPPLRALGSWRPHDRPGCHHPGKSLGSSVRVLTRDVITLVSLWGPASEYSFLLQARGGLPVRGCGLCSVCTRLPNTGRWSRRLTAGMAPEPAPSSTFVSQTRKRRLREGRCHLLGPWLAARACSGNQVSCPRVYFFPSQCAALLLLMERNTATMRMCTQSNHNAIHCDSAKNCVNL